jgi:hypothetical protein
LLRVEPPEGRRVLEVTSHLNAGSALLDDSAERLRLAELNLTAGRINRAAAAFADAWETTMRGAVARRRLGNALRPCDLHVEAAGVAPPVGEAVALPVPVLAHRARRWMRWRRIAA